MKIKLIKLTLLNFKGVRSLDVRFSEVTDIFGDNATGKTTVADAFLWLLFGKDSTDRKTFEIKTLGPDNKPYHRMDHEVSATLDIDGREIYLKKVYKEKWEKKRGEQQPVFTGHKNEFYWNDVPLKEEEYQGKISALLDENVFKLITNTAYFNTRPWQERRSVLLNIAGDISNEEIFDIIITIPNKHQFVPLINALNSNKTTEEFKKEISAKKKKIKDDLDLVPARIDEATRSLPDLIDYGSLLNQLQGLQNEYETVDQELLDKNAVQKQKQDLLSNKWQQINDLNSQLQQLEFVEKNKIIDGKRNREQELVNLRRNLKNMLDEVSRNAVEISNNNTRKSALQVKQNDLRNKWAAVDAEKLEFKEGQFKCPTCKRDYEAADIEEKKGELTRNFNQSKSWRLEEIVKDGKRLGVEITEIETVITSIKNRDQALQSEIKILQETINQKEETNKNTSVNESLQIYKNLASDEKYTSIKNQLSVLEQEVNIKEEAGHMQSLLIAKKKELSAKIDAIKNQLAGKEQREKTEKRIEELKTHERELGQELAKLEGIEFSIMQFERAKMDELENRVNSRFKIVKFKLFEQQINEGEKPNCITLINGVPYPDANNAAKIQAGLDIINTLSDHYNVTAPIFIDNRESVVNLPESKSQIINLIVSAEDKKLRVVNENSSVLVAV